jgi:hypothetical protein
MTTAIGFKCQDGIILAADSEISEGWSKYEESKIIRFNADCFFAYAGRSLVVKDRMADFQRASEGPDVATVQANFRGAYASIWQEALKGTLKEKPTPIRIFCS